MLNVCHISTVLLALVASTTLYGQTQPSSVALGEHKIELAKNRLESVHRLRRSGSASGQELRQAQHQYELAKLQLARLQQPDNQQDIEVAIAKLNLEYATTEFEILERLYQQGSVSKHDYQRARTVKQIAHLQLQGKQHPEREKFIKFKIAVAHQALAKFEFELARRLIKTGAISQERHDHFLTQLKSAETRVEQRRKELGASAKSIRQ